MCIFLVKNLVIKHTQADRRDSHPKDMILGQVHLQTHFRADSQNTHVKK